MPMHDWTRVDPNDYHDFHLTWIGMLKSALNDGRLPAGYIALAEHTTPPIVPDIITLSMPGRAGDQPPSLDGGLAIATAPPKVRFAATTDGRKQTTVGRRRVAIRHARNRHLVAVIEIVSPSNKAKRSELRDLIGKSVQLLRQGVHLVLIDPFPPTDRDPYGLHAVVWKELTGERFTPPVDKPLTVAAYAALGENKYSSYVEPVAVGDLLPELPLFLTAERYILTPLEETYRAAWAGFPAELRTIVEGQ